MNIKEFRNELGIFSKKDMDEYAKQEAIGFIKAYWFGEIEFEKEPDTAEELYELYLKSQLPRQK